jgi:arsenite methyltransferase
MDKEYLKEYYGRILKSSEDSTCKTCSKPSDEILNIMKLIPEEVTNKYYGCGIPITKDIKEGDRVLDLGSGSGQDCYIMAKLVGPAGSVIGIDMTDEQIVVANGNIETYAKNLGWKPNMNFRKGFIEDLKDVHVDNNSIDVCISNCVICLSSDKPAVFKEVYRSLHKGGKFIFSDLYTYVPIPDEVKNHPAVVKECLGDVLIKSEFEKLAKEIGFQGLVVINDNYSKINGVDFDYRSITYSLTK